MKLQILYILFFVTSFCEAADQIFGYFDQVTGQFVNLSPQSTGGIETPSINLTQPYQPKFNPVTGYEIRTYDPRPDAIRTVRDGFLSDGRNLLNVEPPREKKPGFLGPEGTKFNRGVAKKCGVPVSQPSGAPGIGSQSVGSTGIQPGVAPTKNPFLNRTNFSACDLNEGPIRAQTSQSQLNGQGVLLAVGGAIQIIQAQTFAPQDQGQVVSGLASLNPLILIDYGRGLPRTAANIASIDTLTALNRMDILYQTGQVSAQSYLQSIEATPGLSQRRKEELIRKLGLRPTNCKYTSFSEVYNQFQGNR